MMNFDPDVVRLYVAHGFRPAPEGVRLKCDPETEAGTFDMGGHHDTWEVLPEIETRVVVLAGNVEEFGPAAIAEPVAERLPNATYIQRDEWNHFAPSSTRRPWPRRSGRDVTAVPTPLGTPTL